MDASQTMDKVRETLSGRYVFGDPVERDGVTVIPAARVRGGGGGGGGGRGEEEPGAGGQGYGGGVGLMAAPAGVFLISDKGVRWRPAVDVNRIILGAQIVAMIALITIGRLMRSR